jgi:hypothetical protein
LFDGAEQVTLLDTTATTLATVEKFVARARAMLQSNKEEHGRNRSGTQKPLKSNTQNNTNLQQKLQGKCLRLKCCRFFVVPRPRNGCAATTERWCRDHGTVVPQPRNAGTPSSFQKPELILIHFRSIRAKTQV